jgi:hypothetical protein
MWQLFIFLVALLCVPLPIFAKYDPLSVPNNKYGIHIVEPNDIADAARLVNSTGGDWGYVTLVMQEDDRDHDKWQRVFNQMRSLHLLPIVRIATHIQGDSWAKPYADSAKDWARFLNSLNWPAENRYVVIFNEPNHANEWGKTLDPEDYARVLKDHAQTLKNTSEDFFILPAGLDVSAASDGRSLDAATYLSRMLRAEPSLFDYLDGWTSHSYPNPAFSGNPFATGRGTLRSFQWEMQYLEQLGLTKKLPVFITETGWVHSEGVTHNSSLLSSEQVGNHITTAASIAWQDPSIVAITPFVMNYQGLPFDHFSWRKLGSNDFYPHFTVYQNIAKTAGTPKQREKYTLNNKIIPESLVAGSTYVLSALLKNEGQGIYSQQDNRYVVELMTEPKFLMVYDPLPVMEPSQYGTLTLHMETPNAPGAYPYVLRVRHGTQDTVIETGSLQLVPPPSIDINIQLGWRPDNSAPSATVLIYDNLTLIHKVQGVSFTEGKATIKELRNVVPGNKYRVVVLVPYYLPQQHITTLKADTTTVTVPRLLPFDFNQDGTLTLGDIPALLSLQPNFIAALFVGP